MTEPVASSAPELHRLQRWMLSVIAHPRGIVAGLDSEPARERYDVGEGNLEAVVSRSKNLDAVARLGVYGDAYFARLLECLRGEYPALSHALGEDTFGAFAVDYLLAHPSSSYTLGNLSSRFPQHLRETQPEADKASDTPTWSDFVIDLATLERTYAEVFDGDGVERDGALSPEDLANVDPNDWPFCRLEPVPCLRLLRFAYPVHDYKTAVARGDTPLPPHPQSTLLAITRRDYVVRRAVCDEGGFALLTRLVEGETVGDAVTATAEQSSLEDAQLAERLQSWFRDWTASGYFRRILHGESRSIGRIRSG